MSRYTRRRPESVEAMRLSHPVTLDTPAGPVHGAAGDYLVTDGARQYIVPAAEFEREYDRASDLVITPNATPQVIPYPVPYPVYPSYPQRYWYADVTYTSPNISIGGGSVSHMTLLGSATAINQSATGLLSAGSVSGSIGD